MLWNTFLNENQAITYEGGRWGLGQQLIQQIITVPIYLVNICYLHLTEIPVEPLIPSIFNQFSAIALLLFSEAIPVLSRLLLMKTSNC